MPERCAEHRAASNDASNSASFAASTGSLPAAVRKAFLSHDEEVGLASAATMSMLGAGATGEMVGLVDTRTVGQDEDKELPAGSTGMGISCVEGQKGRDIAASLKPPLRGFREAPGLGPGVAA